MNWFAPAVWAGINEAQKRVGSWSAEKIVQSLQKNELGRSVYGSLHRATVWKWIDKDGTGWSRETLEKVEANRRQKFVGDKSRKGRPRILVRAG